MVLLPSTGDAEQVSREQVCGDDVTSDDPLGYSWRGEFCEGRCSVDVAAQTVDLLSLHLGQVPPLNGEPVHLSWAWRDFGTDRVLIRSADHEVCYRLDHAQPSLLGSFTWPTEVAARLGPSPANVGVSVLRKVGGESLRVPVRWNHVAEGPLISRWWVQVPLRSVDASWHSVEAGGGLSFDLRFDAARWQGYQPGMEVLDLELEPPPSAGVWDLRWTAEEVSGQPLTARFRVVYEPGAAVRDTER